eukprot:PRCOL_00003633-RA
MLLAAKAGRRFSAFASRAAAAAPRRAPVVAAPRRSRKANNIIDVLRSRGLIDAVTAEDALRSAANNHSLRVYCGFDPTADSLHLGNLLGIVVLEWFRRCGHGAVALVGGATARIGDPSGKSAERPMMDDEVLERNLRAIGAQLGKLLRAEVDVVAGEEGGEEAEGADDSSADATTADATAGSIAILDNMSWYRDMSALEFLRDIGRFARVSVMMNKDSVKSRLSSEDGMSFTEFSYQLLQGWDFAHLHREHGVRVQIGGSDQWGNITAGTDLIRKTATSSGASSDAPEAAGEQEEVSSSSPSSSSQQQEQEQETTTTTTTTTTSPPAFGLTFPLLLKADGTKFGKSVDGAIWLSPEKLSPFKFYQAIFKTADADVVKFLRMLTFLPLEEVDAIAASMGEAAYRPNDAQRRLAEEVTRFVHGEEGLRAALAATEALKPGSDTVLDVATLEAIAEDMPTATLPLERVAGAPVFDVMVAAGMQPSKSAARRMIKSGGVRVNNVKVGDEGALIADEDVIEGKLVLLAAGKKNKMLVRIG